MGMVITLRITEEQKAKWWRAASSAGCDNLSEWIREQCEEGDDVPRQGRPKQAWEEPGLIEVVAQSEGRIENSKAEDPVGNDGMDLPRGGTRSAGRLGGGDQCELPPPCKHGAHPGMCRHAECREGWKLKQ